MSLLIPWVALSWFMWSWKSTVWKALADKITPSIYVDVDKVISNKHIWMSIWDFLKQNSMWKFRALETQAIKSVLWNTLFDTVNIISLWWWAVTVPENVRNIKGIGLKLVYLDVPFDVIAERLREDHEWNADRVPFDEGKFRKLYLERQEIYRSTADKVIKNTMWVQICVDEILLELKIAA